MLEELREACALASQDESETLALGPLVSFFGHPAPAGPGAIALKLGDAGAVIREADIVRIEKHNGLYQVWTRSDANVIIRMETVAKASGKPRPCACGDKFTEQNAGIIIELPPITLPDINCEPRYICFTVWGREFCTLYYVCTVGLPIGVP